LWYGIYRASWEARDPIRIEQTEIVRAEKERQAERERERERGEKDSEVI